MITRLGATTLAVLSLGVGYGLAQTLSDYTFYTTQEEGEILASELMYGTVENPDGEILGDVVDVVINENLEVKALIVGVGGFLGLLQKHVAVRFDEIDRIRDTDTGEVSLVFETSEPELRAAPEFQTLADQMAETEREELFAE
jgi:sporulation protein YlmC with PRC-barrel domain